MEMTFIKTPAGFVPSDPKTGEYAEKMKMGASIHGDFKKMRNAAFHRKGMSLLWLAFEYWQPGQINCKYGTPLKNFDRFRKDLTILAGFYEVYIRVDGTTRVEAKSLSFGSMEEEEFGRVYQGLLTVIAERILPKIPEDKIEEMADKFWGYA